MKNKKEQKNSYKLRVQLDKGKSAKNVRRVQNWRLKKQINEDIAGGTGDRTIKSGK